MWQKLGKVFFYMQRLLVLYFVGLFIFAGLIFVVDRAERESSGVATDDPEHEAAAPEQPRARSAHRATDAERGLSAEGGRITEADEAPVEDGVTSRREAEQSVFQQEREAFERPYLALGYSSVVDAVRDCEMRYMQKIYLPFYMPPVGFTHQLAICSTHYTDQDYLEINYLHESRPDHRYMILMRPGKYGIEVPPSRILRTYELNDGTEALLSLTPEEGYHVLTFERWGWQYMLVVPTKLKDRFPPDEMVKVANSVQSGYPHRVAWRY